MEEENTQSVNEGKETEKEPLKAKAEKEAKSEPKTGGGWGGWGFSPLSVLSDLQKAAEEISRNVRILLPPFPTFLLRFSGDRLAPVLISLCLGN